MSNTKGVQNNSSERRSGVHTQTVIAQISSPLPPPEMLANYEHIQSGLIDKIIAMTDLEGTHRRDLERENLYAEIASLQRGDALISRAQVFAFVLSLLTVMVGGTIGYFGAEIAGSVIGASGVVGIIVAFLKNSKR